MQYLQAGLRPIDPCASSQKPLQEPGGSHVGGQRELVAERRGDIEGVGNWRASQCFTIMLYEQFKAVRGIHVPGWIIHDAL